MRANPSANVTGGVVSGNDTGTVILVETPSKVILFQASATYSVGARYELDAEL
jgi:cytidylate kinase